MRTSHKGIVELCNHEAAVICPYLDSVKVWSFGVGHTASAGLPTPSKMVKGKELPLSYVIDVLIQDLAKFEARVSRAFKVTLTQEQFDAAVSFDFNTGDIDTCTWVKRFNAGDIVGAREAFMWYHIPAEIIPRREKECALFFDGVYAYDGKTVPVYRASAKGTVIWGSRKLVDASEVLPVTEQETASTSGKPALTWWQKLLAFFGVYNG